MGMFLIFCFIIVTLFVFFISNEFKKSHKQLNSVANSMYEHGPCFEVIKVEQTLDFNYNCVAKYTVEVCFFAKKDNKGWRRNEYYFYDRIGEYNIGDKIKLSK